MISFLEARKQILETVEIIGTETIQLDESLGRVLAEDILADRDYPPFNRAAMDGFALRSEDLLNKNFKEFRIAGEVFAGDTYNKTIHPGECIRIMTGAPVPEGADIVIKVEDTTVTGKQMSPDPEENIVHWLNISRKGEDLSEREVYVKKGEIINHSISGAAAVTGKNQLQVYKQPRIAIISTGDEIVPIDQPVRFYQIRNSNNYMLTGLLKNLQINPAFLELVKDDKEQLRTTIEKVFDCDIVMLSGGVSMGDADYVPEILKNLGVREVFHKTAIKPGKPVWFGTKPDHGVVFGLPGNPLSIQASYKLFAEPWIIKSIGMEVPEPKRVILNDTRMKKGPLDHFFPCILNDDMTLSITPFNGSGDITSTVLTDGIAHHPADMPKLKIGTKVDFYPWRMF